MIVGDHLLPKITPHVGYLPGGPDDPLGDFLASQRKVQRFDVASVLPAHGGVFNDHRLPRQPDHRASRVPHAGDARRHRHGPATAYEIATKTFGFDAESPLAVQFPATFETLAHLQHLMRLGRIESEERDGEVRWRVR